MWFRKDPAQDRGLWRWIRHPRREYLIWSWAWDLEAAEADDWADPWWEAV